MRYVISKVKLYDREFTYRIYVTDALKSFMGLKIRYADLFKQSNDGEEEKTSEEIIENIKNKLRGM